MIALGINSVYHESAAALLVGDKLVAAAEEERFNRRKHGKPAAIDNPDVLPVQAIRFCLERAGIEAAKIDRVAFSFDPKLRRAAFQPDPNAAPGDWGTAEGEAIFQRSLARVPDAISELLGRDISTCFSWIPHHLAHAASSFYCAGEPSAAILVVDGIAESASTLLGRGHGGRIDALDELHYPHSLGFLWEKLSVYLGFSEYDACKVMGMAAYGDKSVYARQLSSLVEVTADGFAVDPAIALFRQPSCEPLQALFGPRRDRGAPLAPRHYHVAAALQDVTDRIMATLLGRLHRLAPEPAVCLGGGVALNCAANGYLAKVSPFRRLYIPPAPHDSGTAIGAAFCAAAAQGPVHFVRENQLPYLGPDHSREQILAALGTCGHSFTRARDPEKLAARWIADGHIVAWFQGRMEFGPRALGNRSLLADPRNPEVREVMNRKVKHRETFRPFGPSVLAEQAADWFELDAESESYAYMLFACPTKADRTSQIPAVLHADNTSRLHLVREAANPPFYRLIRHFYELTGVPLVLNTSFNDSEPIVCSPDDALLTFQQTSIDALFIGDFVLTRQLTVPEPFRIP